MWRAGGYREGDKRPESHAASSQSYPSPGGQPDTAEISWAKNEYIAQRLYRTVSRKHIQTHLLTAALQAPQS